MKIDRNEARNQVWEFIMALLDGEITTLKDICELFNENCTTFKNIVYSVLAKACDDGILVKSVKYGNNPVSWKRVNLTPDKIMEYQISPALFVKGVVEYINNLNKELAKKKEEKKPDKDFQDVLSQNTLLQEKLSNRTVEISSLKAELKKLEEKLEIVNRAIRILK